MGSLCTSVLCLFIIISVGSSWEKFLAKCAIAAWALTAEVSFSSQLSSLVRDFKSSHY